MGLGASAGGKAWWDKTEEYKLLTGEAVKPGFVVGPKGDFSSFLVRRTFEKQVASRLKMYLQKASIPSDGEYHIYLDFQRKDLALDTQRYVPLFRYYIEVSGRFFLFEVSVSSEISIETGMARFGQIKELKEYNEPLESWIQKFEKSPNVFRSTELLGPHAIGSQKGETIGHWYDYSKSVTLRRTPGGDNEILINGNFGLKAGTMTPFNEAIARLPKDKSFSVVLNSMGGSRYVFEEMGKKLREKCIQENSSGRICKTCEIRTHVESGSYCGSACVGLYSVGTQKTYGQFALFGFHSAANIVDGKLSDEQETQNILSGWGFRPAWLQEESIKGTLRRSEMTYYGGQALHNSGLFDIEDIPSCN